MSAPNDAELAALLLRASTELLDGIQAGVQRRGFDDIRPMHGYAFVRISAGAATVLDIASYLGVTKQAASQLVEQLVQRGYVRREPDPNDARAKLLVLTPRGRSCTRAADAAAAEVIAGWRAGIGDRKLAGLAAALRKVVTAGPLRPNW